jgi:(4-(4-[2-(gamma-L-glutamylamino)ethyl]phenoxymethyl)furan-2-yl)methanamine synthase
VNGDSTSNIQDGYDLHARTQQGIEDMRQAGAVLGWDIGGVNTKVARLSPTAGGPTLRSASVMFEIKNAPLALADTLVRAASSVGSEPGDRHAVTMTAELSQAFHTKREGVEFILDALEATFSGCELAVYTVDGSFCSTTEARKVPLLVSAANWAATASLVARSIPTCVVMDIGTTSADLIPVVNGEIVALGRTDPERLLSGELVYTGALRTPAEAIVSHVPLWDGHASVAADGFALIGDAHLWLGHLDPSDYTCRTPDGSAPNRGSAAERLARVVCADRDILDDQGVDRIASALARAQVNTVAAALGRILERWPAITLAVTTGLGDFIATEAAVNLGLEVVPLSGRLGPSAQMAPAAAVAWLLWSNMESARD